MGIVITLFIFGVIAIVLLGLGVWFTRYGFRGLIAARASTNWPSTMGKILSAQVVEQKPVGTYSGSGSRRIDYRPVLQYSYSIAGKSYGGEHRIFNDDVIVYGSIQKAQAAIRNYPAGKIVQVFYDPSHPAYAVLEPGKAGPSWRSLTSGLLCLLLALFPVWMVITIAANPPH